MKYRSLTGLSALIALSAFAHAQAIDNSAPKGLDNVQHELDAWRAEHGAGWQVKFDNAFGYARFLYGGNAAPAFTPRQDADFLALGRQVARDTFKLHGIEASTLVDDSVDFLPLSNAGSSDKMTAQFRQMVNGVPVELGFFNVLFDLNGRVLSVDTTGLPGIAGMITTSALSNGSAGAAQPPSNGKMTAKSSPRLSAGADNRVAVDFPEPDGPAKIHALASRSTPAP